jgi:hypothetical protein
MKRKEGRTGVGMNLVKVVVVRASGRLSFNSPAITTTTSPPPPPHFVPYKGRSFVHVSPRKKKINHLGPNNNKKLNKKKKLKFECWRAK